MVKAENHEMAPETVETVNIGLNVNGSHSGLDSEAVVISGMSGSFPKALHVKDFEEILLNKIDPIASCKPRWEEERYKISNNELVNHLGTLPDLGSFDAQFFKVHNRHSPDLDPVSRLFLEHSHQALFDAGVSSDSLAGKKIGVYTTSTLSEMETVLYGNSNYITSFSLSGCSKSMTANRISYWLDVNGPSYAIEAGCSSTTVAIGQAYKDLCRDEIEGAIVATGTTILHPYSVIHIGRALQLSKQGKLMSFDQNADGSVLSEAVCVFYLQKAKTALRAYAEIVNVSSQFIPSIGDVEYKFYRNPDKTSEYLEDFYLKTGLSPASVEYVEACGIGIKDVDEKELNIIEKVFCKNRKQPLLVGSVRSNIGLSLAASGGVSLTKLLLAYQRGVIPANLHCENPYSTPALKDGRMQIVTDNKEFKRAYTAILDPGLTGDNAHMLLKGCHKQKDLNRYKSNIPYLVTVSGRQELSAQEIIDYLKTQPIDPEAMGLLHNIHESKNSVHLGRGYLILDTDKEGKTVCLAEEVAHSDDLNRPLWFVYSGMGSQWAGMGAQLMRIPTFAAAIKKCDNALKPKGLDIFHIITSNEKNIFDNILNSFVGIAAIQIGLTDVLYEMGIKPDNIIGHSVGELGCGYADGCLTAEEMILAAYSRGLVSIQTPLIRGSMAAVGIGYENVVKLCPPEIEVACHNGPESSTISGPAEIMTEFVASLTAKGIFAKEVPCSNIAYHSRYIAEAGPKLFEHLSKVIPNPKRRSERWLSTSLPQKRWGETEAQYCSAWYQTNNLLSQVLFEETSRMVPSNAVVIEVAPHGLLQAILKRSLSPECRNIPLARRGHPDNVVYFLEAVGKIYTAGYQPKVKELYPKIEFPVSTATPMLSHLIKWNHAEQWSLPLMLPVVKKMSSIRNLYVSLHDQEYSHLRNCVIRGKTVYPYSAVLNAVWDTFILIKNIEAEKLSVQFRNVHFFVQPVLQEKRFSEIQITLHKGTGQFQVADECSRIAVGFIGEYNKKLEPSNVVEPDSKAVLNLDSKQIYSLLQEREYEYKNNFRCIHKSDYTFDNAQIVWNNDWTSFLEGIIQLNALKRPHAAVSLPLHFHKLSIDVKKHLNSIQLVDGKSVIPTVTTISNYTRCGGILLEKPKYYDFPSSHTNLMELKALEFVPRSLSSCKDLSTSYEVFLQIVAENLNLDTLKVIEVTADNIHKNELNIKQIVNSLPGTNYVYENVNINTARERNILQYANVVIVKNLKMNKNLEIVLEQNLPVNTFVINRENVNTNTEKIYNVVSDHKTTNEKLELAIWKPQKKTHSVSSVHIKSESDLETLRISKEKVPVGHKLVIITHHPLAYKLREMVNQWRKQLINNEFCVISVKSVKNVEQFSWNTVNLSLTFNSMHDNVLGGEYYVSWRESIAIERDVALHSKKNGDLNSLYWVEETNSSDIGSAVTVRYAGINYFDANIATGIIPVTQEYLDTNSYGMDYSGIVSSGDRVMGLVKGGSTKGRVIAIPELLWPVPSNWTLEDAATVPLAYAQAFYCLGIKAPLYPGTTIMINSGAGALGQALISVALAYRCTVFTTVSSVNKKKFLLKLFPALREQNIGNSRDQTFVDLVMQLTNGLGCDIVIGSLCNELANSILDCGGFSSIILDTAQVHSNRTFRYGMHYLTKQRTYMQADFDAIFDNVEVMKSIQLMISEGIALGYVLPLSRITYAAQDAAKAFRLVAGSRHRGRVLLRMRDTIIPVQPKFTCSTMYKQLIVADDEALAYIFAENLIKCGARKLYINLSQSSSALYEYKNNMWRKLQAEVKVGSKNLTIAKNVEDLLSETSFEGIYFVSSGDVRNNMILSTFDEKSRKLCPSLRYFAVFSGNDNFGKDIQLRRSEAGFPSTTICLPVLESVNGSDLKVIPKKIVQDVVEQALHSTHRYLRIHFSQDFKSLLTKICELTDLNVPEDTKDTITLQNLNFDNSYAPTISALLKNEYYVAIPEDEISNLSLKQIKYIDERVRDPTLNAVNGIESYFVSLGSDELVRAVSIQPLKTIFESKSVRDYELDVNLQYAILIPGLEGYFKRFLNTSKRLKMPALSLQPGFEFPEESIQETALRYVKLLNAKTNTRDKRRFFLLGYETGILIALEVAAILEKEGKLGIVYCVGGGPNDIINTIKKAAVDLKTEEALQDAVILNYANLAMEVVPDKIVSDVKSASSWEEKLNVFLQAIVKATSYSRTYLKSLCEVAYKRIKEIMKYQSNVVGLKSRIVVIHSSSSTTTGTTQYLSKQPVVEERIDASLSNLLQHPRCATIINTHLPDDILHLFNTHVKCDLFVSSLAMFYKATMITTSEDK